MRANRSYELIVSRGGRGPALLADREQRDRVEVVEIASGEVVLFWDTEARHTRRLARALRADLSQLDTEDFLERWRRWDPVA